MLDIGNCVNCVNIYGPSYCQSFRFLLHPLHVVSPSLCPSLLPLVNREFASKLINYVWQYANWKVTFILRLAAPDSLHTQQANKGRERWTGGGGGKWAWAWALGWLSLYLFSFFVRSGEINYLSSGCAVWQSANWQFPNCQPQAKGVWQQGVRGGCSC